MQLSLLGSNEVVCSCHFTSKNIPSIFFIKRIGQKAAIRLVIEKHYLHRQAPCSDAFGLFCRSCGKIAGVITYGTPSSAPLRSGICGEKEKDNVAELTRLWTRDEIPKNSESFLIGNTIGLIQKEIIVSYAEKNQGHVGTVYQATNWHYTGLSAKRTNWDVNGSQKHSQTLADQYSASELREHYGNSFQVVDRPRKHRYVYFNTNKARKKELFKKLNYKIQPYPKQNPLI